MNKLTEAKVMPFKESDYIKPVSIDFTINDLNRKWQLLQVPDDVAVLIYNTTRKVLVFVKQFRAPVYLSNIPIEDRTSNIDINKYLVDLGITLELCSAAVDADLSLENIAVQGIQNGCGYKVPTECLEFVTSYRCGLGTSGCLTTCFYCEVTDNMKVACRGGSDEEAVEVVELTIPQIKEYISQDHINSPPSFLFGVSWFLLQKAECSNWYKGVGH